MTHKHTTLSNIDQRILAITANSVVYQKDAVEYFIKKVNKATQPVSADSSPVKTEITA